MPKQLDERLKKEGVKTHKQRVEELNKYLSNLSEHHDMYVSLFLPPSSLPRFSLPPSLSFSVSFCILPYYPTHNPRAFLWLVERSWEWGRRGRWMGKLRGKANGKEAIGCKKKKKKDQKADYRMCGNRPRIGPG
jgi:hypothetical protein